MSYDNATNEHAPIILNAIPDVFGVVELSVQHFLKHKLFSKAVKRQYFGLCIDKYNLDETLELYFYETEKFEEVYNIIEAFVNNQIIPDLSSWKQKYIG